MQLADSGKALELAKVVAKVNLCFSQFHLPDELIYDWCKTLLEYSPELDFAKVQFLIKQFHLGELEFNRDQGIQNFTVNLKRVRRHGNGFRLGSPRTGY